LKTKGESYTILVERGEKEGTMPQNKKEEGGGGGCGMERGKVCNLQLREWRHIGLCLYGVWSGSWVTTNEGDQGGGEKKMDRNGGSINGDGPETVMDNTRGFSLHQWGEEGQG